MNLRLDQIDQICHMIFFHLRLKIFGFHNIVSTGHQLFFCILLKKCILLNVYDDILFFF